MMDKKHTLERRWDGTLYCIDCHATWSGTWPLYRIEMDACVGVYGYTLPDYALDDGDALLNAWREEKGIS